MNQLAQRIRARREELGMTREQLADRANCAKSSIERWETGYAQKMSIEKLFTLSKTLETTTEALWGDVS